MQVRHGGPIPLQLYLHLPVCRWIRPCKSAPLKAGIFVSLRLRSSTNENMYEYAYKLATTKADLAINIM